MPYRRRVLKCGLSAGPPLPTTQSASGKLTFKTGIIFPSVRVTVAAATLSTRRISITQVVALYSNCLCTSMLSSIAQPVSRAGQRNHGTKPVDDDLAQLEGFLMTNVLPDEDYIGGLDIRIDRFGDVSKKLTLESPLR
ncbi:uncharacterized protein LACBIDRAFT_332077 [Laccaria bicolor S238N-H82]|uniref:Predicted protein n=1 Tax=Laccaria bicolor (strain S238N-H82 / ATCC MYA-4686) TaxID=486041 RepID=B0DRI0_LACBS|nr:uncharacterized protein LACBIDRAFT_332077 [Laccaria bicolor S238N-H82]EDR02876.1 predicted protein [Laccaria bicolor S238N-H82]|eukprot:XP_001886586.1 predicted protein [Laccaria bicolor S238N-H82]